MRSRNKEKLNTTKNYGILTRKDLEDSRELTGREVTDKWASRSIGGAGPSHMLGSWGQLLHYDFYHLSNPEKYIFALRNVRRMAVV